MKKALLSLIAITLLFSCNKHEVSTSPANTFDDAAFIRSLEEISANALRKGTHPAAKGKFWRILKIIASDIGGGITGALGGLELTNGTTAGGIIGGVAGATAASTKAAEQHVVTADATPNFKAKLKLAPHLQFNTHVPSIIGEINPFASFGEFHNAELAQLTPNINTEGGPVTAPGQVQYHDSYNQTEIEKALNRDPYFQPYYSELLDAGQPYSLDQYKRATSFVNIFAYDSDSAYCQAVVDKARAIGYRPLLTTSQTIYRLFFKTIEGLETIEQVEEFIVLYTRQVLAMPESYPDRDILLQTFAVAAYSTDFWYTINE